MCECVSVCVCICAVRKSSCILTITQREIWFIILQNHKYIKRSAKLALMERNVVICMHVCTYVYMYYLRCMYVFRHVGNSCPLQKSKFHHYVLSVPHNYHDFIFISIKYRNPNIRISGQFVSINNSVSPTKRSLKHEIKGIQFRHFWFFWYEKRVRNINQHTWK